MSLLEPTKEEILDYMVSKGADRPMAEELYDSGFVHDYKTADQWLPEAHF